MSKEYVHQHHDVRFFRMIITPPICSHTNFDGVCEFFTEHFLVLPACCISLSELGRSVEGTE